MREGGRGEEGGGAEGGEEGGGGSSEEQLPATTPHTAMPASCSHMHAPPTCHDPATHSHASIMLTHVPPTPCCQVEHHTTPTFAVPAKSVPPLLTVLRGQLVLSTAAVQVVASAPPFELASKCSPNVSSAPCASRSPALWVTGASALATPPCRQAGRQASRR